MYATILTVTAMALIWFYTMKTIRDKAAPDIFDKPIKNREMV